MQHDPTHQPDLSARRVCASSYFGEQRMKEAAFICTDAEFSHKNDCTQTCRLRRGVTVTKTHVTLAQEVNQTTTELGESHCI